MLGASADNDPEASIVDRQPASPVGRARLVVQ
jgi:hypothetical protein